MGQQRVPQLDKREKPEPFDHSSLNFDFGSRSFWTIKITYVWWISFPAQVKPSGFLRFAHLDPDSLYPWRPDYTHLLAILLFMFQFHYL
ncbi:hypothetical protein AMECASPLE_021787 [Ameca splendens]|uniref:Uncharacterized protein n=1 Tax=Ameca splendens TaxID=208324 RepID=A0ABV0ZCH3_9TELE